MIHTNLSPEYSLGISRRLLVGLLRNAKNIPDWSIQGLGMLRLYLDPEKRFRLHVWSPEDATPNVSTLHDHPWGFRSTILAGAITNVLYRRHPNGCLWKSATIKCGPGGCMDEETIKDVLLYQSVQKVYTAGESYEQTAADIHESMPYDGTVTLVERFFGKDKDHARVFWRPDKYWVSAEPRPATLWEIERITKNALDRWF